MCVSLKLVGKIVELRYIIQPKEIPPSPWRPRSTDTECPVTVSYYGSELRSHKTPLHLWLVDFVGCVLYARVWLLRLWQSLFSLFYKLFLFFWLLPSEPTLTVKSSPELRMSDPDKSSRRPGQRLKRSLCLPQNSCSVSAWGECLGRYLERLVACPIISKGTNKFIGQCY